jgi:hypothetical protein
MPLSCVTGPAVLNSAALAMWDWMMGLSRVAEPLARPAPTEMKRCQKQGSGRALLCERLTPASESQTDCPGCATLLACFISAV